MSKRKPDVYLQDILESIRHIEQYLEGVDEDEFYRNPEKQDAILRRLEIIGRPLNTFLRKSVKPMIIFPEEKLQV